MLSEGEIYVVIKEWLKIQGWSIIGGEPPGGTNVIPRIEIKDPQYTGRGSKGSKKIDLVGFKKGYFLLTEIKPRRSSSDAIKLREIVSRKELRAAFIRALVEKRALPSSALETEKYAESSEFLSKSQAFSGPIVPPPDDFIFFIVSGSSVKPRFGPSVSDDIRSLFP